MWGNWKEEIKLQLHFLARKKNQIVMKSQQKTKSALSRPATQPNTAVKNNVFAVMYIYNNVVISIQI